MIFGSFSHKHYLSYNNDLKQSVFFTCVRYTKVVQGNADVFQQFKIANLENKTNSIEQNMTLLTSKLENLQLNFLANQQKSKPCQNSGNIEIQEIYLCDTCDYRDNNKASLVHHKQEKHRKPENTFSCKSVNTNQITNSFSKATMKQLINLIRKR